MYQVRIRPVTDPQEPGAVQGSCTCGEAGPETLSEENATLWGIGHADGHKAIRTPKLK